MPVDDGAERIDDDQRAHPIVGEHGGRGVAEPEAANDDVEVVPVDLGQCKSGDLHLRNGEQARHQELVVKLRLVDLLTGDRIQPAAKADDAHGRLLRVEELKPSTHVSPLLSAGARPAWARPHHRRPGETKASPSADSARRRHGVAPRPGPVRGWLDRPMTTVALFHSVLGVRQGRARRGRPIARSWPRRPGRRPLRRSHLRRLRTGHVLRLGGDRAPDPQRTCTGRGGRAAGRFRHRWLLTRLHHGRPRGDAAPGLGGAHGGRRDPGVGFGDEVRWPAGIPAQTHSTVGDPWREQEEIDAAVRDVEAGGGRIEVFDYPGSGHLFTDPSLPAEYDPAATETFWARALPFVGARG